MQIVCKFRFVRYGHIKKNLALYVPRFNFDHPLKFEVTQFSNSNILGFVDFRALDLNFHLALKLKVLKQRAHLLETGPPFMSSSVHMMELPQKVPRPVTFGAKATHTPPFMENFIIAKLSSSWLATRLSPVQLIYFGNISDIPS